MKLEAGDYSCTYIESVGMYLVWNERLEYKVGNIDTTSVPMIFRYTDSKHYLTLSDIEAIRLFMKQLGGI